MFSFKIVLNPVPNQDGLHSLRIQFVVERKAQRVTLPIAVEAEKWDAGSGKLKRGAKDFAAKNMLIEDALARASDLKTRMYLDSRQASLSEVVKLWKKGGDVSSALDWIRARIDVEYQRGNYQQAVWRRHHASVKILEGWLASRKTDVLRWADFSPGLVSDLDMYIAQLQVQRKSRTNTLRRVVQKTLRKFLRIAKEEGIRFAWPFVRGSSIKEGQGERVWLEKDELMALLGLWKREDLSDIQRRTLVVFAFQCFSGLRIGDALGIVPAQIRKTYIEVLPQKTKLSSGERVRVPISPALRQVMAMAKTWEEEDRIYRKIERVLPTISANETNKQLKRLAKMAGIKKALKTHAGRHTFATSFLENGGSVDVLKDLLGHRKIETTMIYTHITSQRKKEQVMAAFPEF